MSVIKKEWDLTIDCTAICLSVQKEVNSGAIKLWIGESTGFGTTSYNLVGENLKKILKVPYLDYSVFVIQNTKFLRNKVAWKMRSSKLQNKHVVIFHGNYKL